MVGSSSRGSISAVPPGLVAIVRQNPSTESAGLLSRRPYGTRRSQIARRMPLGGLVSWWLLTRNQPVVSRTSGGHWTLAGMTPRRSRRTDWKSVLRLLRAVATLHFAAFAVDADFVLAVTVPVAHDRFVVRAAEMLDAVFGIDHAVAVGIQNPRALAIDADVVHAVAVPVAHDGDVAGLTEVDHRFTGLPAAVAVVVQDPLAGAEDADGGHAVAVPVAGHGDVAPLAVIEDVVDDVGPLAAGGGELEDPLLGVGHFQRRRQVELGAAGGLVGPVGQARLDHHRPRVGRPLRSEDSDVGLAVAVPVAGDRQVSVGAELGVEVSFVPDTVAVDVDEPLAAAIDAGLGDAVAVEVAGHRNAVGRAEDVLHVRRRAGTLGKQPLGAVHL